MQCFVKLVSSLVKRNSALCHQNHQQDQQRNHMLTLTSLHFSFLKHSSTKVLNNIHAIKFEVESCNSEFLLVVIMVFLNVKKSSTCDSYGHKNTCVSQRILCLPVVFINTFVLPWILCLPVISAPNPIKI